MAGKEQQVVGVILTLVIAAAVGFVGLSVMSQMSESTDTGDPVTVDGMEAVDPQTGELTFERQVKSFSRVNSSAGYAVEFDGTGHLDATAALDYASDSWEVCTWTALNTSGGDQTVLGVSGDRAIIYNASTDEYRGIWFDTGERVTYDVAVSANGTAASRTHVCLAADAEADTLTIYRNASASSSVAVDGNHTATTAWNASNLDGWLEETRVFGAPLNGSQRSEIVASPIHPLPGADRRARLMYDEGSGSAVAVYFADGDAQLDNGTWTDGFDGTELSEGTDYEVTDYGLELQQSSEWYGAPALSIGATLDSWSVEAANRLTGAYTSAMSFTDAIFLVLMAMLTLGVMTSLRRQR